MCEISATSEPSCSISGAFLISRLRKESLVITFSTMTSPFLPLLLFAPVALVARLAPVRVAATATPHLPSHRSRAHVYARAKSVPRIPEHTTKLERLFDGVSGRKTEPQYAKFRTISGPKRKSRPTRHQPCAQPQSSSIPKTSPPLICPGSHVNRLTSASGQNPLSRFVILACFREPGHSSFHEPHKTRTETAE